jgi:hypothetical protein
MVARRFIAVYRSLGSDVNGAKIRRFGMFVPRRRALEFGGLETAIWSEAEAVEDSTTQLGWSLVQIASPNLQGLPTFDGSSINSEF